MEEKIYTIPLIKAKSVPRTKRAKRAIKEIKEFLSRHMKVETVKVDKSVNELVWSRGIKKIPSKVRIKAVKMEDVAWAYTPEAEIDIEEKKKKKEKPPVEEKEEEEEEMEEIAEEERGEEIEEVEESKEMEEDIEVKEEGVEEKKEGN